MNKNGPNPPRKNRYFLRNFKRHSDNVCFISETRVYPFLIHLCFKFMKARGSYNVDGSVDIFRK